KGVVHTHRAIVNKGHVFGWRWGLRPNDRVCTALPFAYAGGSVLSILGTMAAGGTLHPLQAHDPLVTLRIISGERCTRWGGAPSMLSSILDHPDFPAYDLSSLRSVLLGGAPVLAPLVERARRLIPSDLAVGYGLTESCGGMTV